MNLNSLLHSNTIKEVNTIPMAPYPICVTVTLPVWQLGVTEQSHTVTERLYIANWPCKSEIFISTVWDPAYTLVSFTRLTE